MKKQQRTLFCAGFGDSAKALARILAAEGWLVVPTTRSEATRARLQAEGFEALLFEDGIADRVPENAVWLISTPPDEEGCPSYNLLQNAAQHARSIFYLSTTGVYGDLDGGWAFEWTPVNPQSPQGERRVLAESQWRSVSADTSFVRLPGIYGPGRNAFENFRKGTARRLVKPGQVFNRIHVADIAGALKAAMAKPSTRVFNVMDDEPAPPQDVVAFAAELLGVEAPPEIPFETADLTPMARSFYGENKRVSNQRLKDELGFTFRYPDYRVALKALLETV